MNPAHIEVLLCIFTYEFWFFILLLLDFDTVYSRLRLFYDVHHDGGITDEQASIILWLNIPLHICILVVLLAKFNAMFRKFNTQTFNNMLYVSFMFYWANFTAVIPSMIEPKLDVCYSFMFHQLFDTQSPYLSLFSRFFLALFNNINQLTFLHTLELEDIGYFEHHWKENKPYNEPIPSYFSRLAMTLQLQDSNLTLSLARKRRKTEERMRKKNRMSGDSSGGGYSDGNIDDLKESIESIN